MNLEEQKQRTFAVARSMSHEQLKKIRSAIDHTLVTGMSFDEFKANVRQILNHKVQE